MVPVAPAFAASLIAIDCSDIPLLTPSSVSCQANAASAAGAQVVYSVTLPEDGYLAAGATFTLVSTANSEVSLANTRIQVDGVNVATVACQVVTSGGATNTYSVCTISLTRAVTAGSTIVITTAVRLHASSGPFTPASFTLYAGSNVQNGGECSKKLGAYTVDRKGSKNVCGAFVPA